MAYKSAPEYFAVFSAFFSDFFSGLASFSGLVSAALTQVRDRASIAAATTVQRAPRRHNRLNELSRFILFLRLTLFRAPGKIVSGTRHNRLPRLNAFVSVLSGDSVPAEPPAE